MRALVILGLLAGCAPVATGQGGYLTNVPHPYGKWFGQELRELCAVEPASELCT